MHQHTSSDESSGHVESSNLGVDRTSATVKGGRRFSFGALVVVGDRKGRVGFGYGKSNEVPQAVEKGEKYAKRSMISIPMIGTTIPHEVEGRFSSSKVRLIPASPGTGVVAGGTLRTILERAGIQDCLTKCYGSTNRKNIVKATFDAISKLRSAEVIASLRKQELGTSAIAEKIEQAKRFMPQAPRTGRAKGPVNTVDQERKGQRRGGPGGGRRRERSAEPPAPAGDSGAAPATNS